VDYSLPETFAYIYIYIYIDIYNKTVKREQRLRASGAGGRSEHPGDATRMPHVAKDAGKMPRAESLGKP
jgi:hypothetical protein